MASASDVLKQLRTELLADSTLMGLLGSNDILREFPKSAKDPPFIVWLLNNRNPDEEVSGVGSSRPNYEFDLFVINPWDADPIYDHLKQNWTIPEEKTTGITVSGARIDLLHFSDLIEVPGTLLEFSSGQLLHQFTIPIGMKIVLSEV